jgi:quercetin dioxygenase-like cupin family protein
MELSERLMQDFDWSQLPQEQVNEKFSRKFLSGEKITLAQLFLKKGCVVPEHHHLSEQISFIVTGRLRFTLEGTVVVRTSNQLICIPSQVPHSVEALEDTMAYDVFSPIREDWMKGEDAYLRR